MSILITWNDVITSLITGVTSSTVFLFLLWNLKPKFKISPNICCEETELNGMLAKIYLFKVINRSCFFKVYDVKVVAQVVTPYKNVNGTNYNLAELPIKFNSTSIVPTFNPLHYFQDLMNGTNTLKTRTDYAIKFFTLDNCKEILRKDGKYIKFQITAKHSLTGFSIVKTMSYAHVSKVQDGSYLSGNSFKIISQHERRGIIRTT